MSTLPLDVITVILICLPAKSLGRFKSVCKSWYDLISDCGFARQHVERSLITHSNLHFVIRTPYLHLADFDTFKNPVELNYPLKKHGRIMCSYTGYLFQGGVDVVGSCYGLVCLVTSGLTFLLYNPTTQTHKYIPSLPDSPRVSDNATLSYKFGFGYASNCTDYKFVRIFQKLYKATGACAYESEVMVYSLKANTWRRGPVVPHFLNGPESWGAYLHETIHWSVEGPQREFLYVAAFNLRDETFSLLPLLNRRIKHYRDLHLGVLDGCLSLSVSYVSFSDMWVMKDYGVAGSWVKLFRVQISQDGFGLEVPVCYSRSREELFVRQHSLVVSVDLKTLESRKLKVAHFDACLDAHVCVENLMVLEDTIAKLI